MNTKLTTVKDKHKKALPQCGREKNILTLGAVGAATLWGAVFADVGVAVIAILNAIRIFLKVATGCG